MGSESRRRLFVEANLAEGARVALTEDQSHRLLHVLRAGRGTALALFNGRDGEWRAELAETGKKRALLRVGERLRAQEPEAGPWLVFAPIKRGPLDLLTEKATELGASVLLPVRTRHTDAQRVNTARLGAIAVEAAEQCGRLTVPEVRAPQPLDALIAAWPAPRRLIVLDETGGGVPIVSAIAALGDAPAAILVGPEGGFAQSELDALRSLTFAVGVDLGPRILRAETAAIAALACWQALRGPDRGIAFQPSP